MSIRRLPPKCRVSPDACASHAHYSLAIASLSSRQPVPPATEELHAGAEELRTLGFDPYNEMTLFDRSMYTAGTAEVRAAALRSAWSDPSSAAIVAARGGYGSVQLLPLLEPSDFADSSKAFVGTATTPPCSPGSR